MVRQFQEIGLLVFAVLVPVFAYANVGLAINDELPSGMLGYGFTEEAFHRGVSLGLDFIAADAGSMDPGPYYLGAGVPFVTRTAPTERPTCPPSAAGRRVTSPAASCPRCRLS